ncbi:hypothetical protein E2542_SST08690 [Spatholobus suberectus]|nr:hypothetical protein E2542_SST08690 [Spatholobus suberectus]
MGFCLCLGQCDTRGKGGSSRVGARNGGDVARRWSLTTRIGGSGASGEGGEGLKRGQRFDFAIDHGGCLLWMGFSFQLVSVCCDANSFMVGLGDGFGFVLFSDGLCFMVLAYHDLYVRGRKRPGCDVVVLLV